jgi:hypothetical protein
MCDKGFSKLLLHIRVLRQLVQYISINYYFPVSAEISDIYSFGLGLDFSRLLARPKMPPKAS